MVLVCTRNRDELDAHTCVVNHTYVVDDLRANPSLDVRRRNSLSANLSLGDGHQVGLSLRLDLRLGRRLRVGHRLGVDVDLGARLRRGEGVVDGLGVVDDLGGDPNAGGGDELRRSLDHGLRLRDRLSVGLDLGLEDGLGVGHGDGGRDSLGLRERRVRTRRGTRKREHKGTHVRHGDRHRVRHGLSLSDRLSAAIAVVAIPATVPVPTSSALWT